MDRTKKMILTFAAGSFLFAAQGQDPYEKDLSLALNMYSNQRAHNVGDILTVVIRETTSSGKTETWNTKKNAEASADAPYFGSTFSGAGSNLLKQFHNFIVRTNNNLPLSTGDSNSNEIYRIKGASEFKGDGQMATSENLTFTFSVRVVDKLENGLLVVRGERRIAIKGESVNLILTGLIRVRDIDSSNQIDSTKVADANIYYENGGDVTRGSRPGYVWRIFQFFNPL